MHRETLDIAIVEQTAFIIQPIDKNAYGVWGDRVMYNAIGSWGDYVQECHIQAQLEDLSSNA